MGLFLMICNSLKGLDTYGRFSSIFFYKGGNLHELLGSVVQSLVSLMSSLVIEMLTVLVSTISYSQVFLLKKCE